MAASFFVLSCIYWILLVSIRRLFKGPLHPGWTFSYEALAEILRRSAAHGITLPIEKMRRGIVSARLHPKIRSVVLHERGTLAGLPTEEFVPHRWTESNGTILYLHGGGYIVCSPATHRDLVSRIAVSSGARTIAIDYRKAPEHPFPAAIDDSIAAYRDLLARGTDEGRLFLAGDSAGGGLVLALLQRVREENLPMPRGGILLSPWCDLEATGESVQHNARFDYLSPDGLEYGAKLYLGGGDRRHPHVSAIHADLTGLPPLLIQSGSAELFLSENKRLAARAADSGVDVVHEVEPGMVHVFQAFASFLPECEPAILRIGGFVRQRLGTNAASKVDESRTDRTLQDAPA